VPTHHNNTKGRKTVHLCKIRRQLSLVRSLPRIVAFGCARSNTVPFGGDRSLALGARECHVAFAALLAADQPQGVDTHLNLNSSVHAFWARHAKPHQAVWCVWACPGWSCSPPSLAGGGRRAGVSTSAKARDRWSGSLSYSIRAWTFLIDLPCYMPCKKHVGVTVETCRV
jgi:hypothetical protein